MSDDRPTYHTPPGWPGAVQAPGSEDWQRTATRWLWGLVPADYREHRLLHEQPALLARLARQTVEAELSAVRTGYRTLRTDLADLVEPQQIEAAIALYTHEGERLQALTRQAILVEDALAHGVRWRPQPRPNPSGESRRGGMG